MLRRDLLASGMMLAAGGLAAASMVGAGAPAAEAAAAAGKKATGLQINHVAGKAGRTADALTSDFAGRVRITEISLLDEETGTLKVKGLLSGNVKKASGSFVRHVKDQAFTATATLTSGGSGARAAAAAAAACPILALNIGAIHLDLLGLVVDLAPVNLNITAQSGPGNLLGNLLCAVANLLNGVGTGSLTGLLGQINQILSGVLTIINGLGG